VRPASQLETLKTMAESYDLILKGGIVVNQDGTGVRDIGIRDSRFAALGDLGRASAGEVIDCRGLHVLPGVIDSHVHFREPGLTHKEDLESGSRGAVFGGVTAVFEMPNTDPVTTTAEVLADKVKRAHHRMHCDFAFYVGATRENTLDLAELERLPGACAVKVFMGSSTGPLLIEDDDGVRNVLNAIGRRAAFHSEDEYRLRERINLRVEGDPRSHPVWRDAQAALMCTQRLVRLAREAGKRIHVLHVTTRHEVAFLTTCKDVATAEATPAHLTLAAPDCYEKLGTLAQLNPPIRDVDNQAGLWLGIAQGVIDSIVNAGRLTLERLVDLTSAGPARVFGIAAKGRIAAGYDADLTVVDLKRRETITDAWIASRAGWTPYASMTVTGWPIGTIIRGRKVMWDGSLTAPAQGERVRFVETLGGQ
jgi:dihydroorotase